MTRKWRIFLAVILAILLILLVLFLPVAGHWVEAASGSEPVIEVLFPKSKTNVIRVIDSEVVIIGSCTDKEGVKMFTVNSEAVQLDSNGYFVYHAVLNENINEFNLQAVDGLGNKTEQKLTVIMSDWISFIFYVDIPYMTVAESGTSQQTDKPLVAAPVMGDKMTIFIPAKNFVEALGGKIIWNAKDKTITMLFQNGKIKIKTTPCIMNSRSFLSLNFIIDQFQPIKIEYDPDLRKLTLFFPIGI